MNPNAAKSRQTDEQRGDSPHSEIRFSEHSQVRAIHTLSQSGEHSIGIRISDQTLIENASEAIARIRSGCTDTPIIPILAQERLERIIGTIEALRGHDRVRILNAIDPSATFKELSDCETRNRIVYCRSLYLQTMRDRSKGRDSGWHTRVMGLQLQLICNANPHINLVWLLREIHPDLVQEH